VSGFWTKRDEVPEHIGILKVSSWVALLGVDEARELCFVENQLVFD